MFDYSDEKNLVYYFVFPGRFMFGFSIDDENSLSFNGSNDPNLLEKLVKQDILHRVSRKSERESRYDVPVDILTSLEKAIIKKDPVLLFSILGRFKKYEVQSES